MFENFPKKYPGDTLSAEHINMLSFLAKKLGFMVVRSNAAYGLELNQNPFPPFKQQTFEITGEVEEDSSGSSSSSSTSSGSGIGLDNDPSIYSISPRYYDHDLAEWRTDEDITYELDSSPIDAEYDVGAYVTAYWDPQRSMWVPTGASSGAVKEGVLDTDLAPADSALEEPSKAELSVYEKDNEIDSDSFGKEEDELVDSGMNILVVNRFTGIEIIPAGTWMVVQRINGQWRPIAADCGVTRLHPDSSSSSSSSSVSTSSSSQS